MTTAERVAVLEAIARAADTVVHTEELVPLDDPNWERLEDLLTEWAGWPEHVEALTHALEALARPESHG